MTELHPIVRLVACAMLTLPAFLASAATKLGPPIEEKKYFASQTIYRFYVRGYKTEVTLDPTRVIPATVRAGDEPELTAINVLGAMAAGSIERFFEYVARTEKERLEKEWFGKNTRIDLPTAEWKRKLSGKHVRLTHRIEYGLTTIIAYETIDPTSKREGKQEQLALELAKDGRWMLIGMEDHPVFKHWRFSGRRRVITE